MITALMPEKISMIPEGTLPEQPNKLELDEEEQIDVLEMLELGISKNMDFEDLYRTIAAHMGRQPHVIRKFCKGIRSRKRLAQAKLMGGVAKMVDKIIDKGSTAELIDILSRPNIGVLDPIKKSEGHAGFVLSVSAETCGAVKIGLASGVPNVIQANTTDRVEHIEGSRPQIESYQRSESADGDPRG